MYLLGQAKVVRHGPLRVWAERGLIRIEDERDNSYKIESVEEFALRTKALNDMLLKTPTEDKLLYADQVHELQRIVSGYIDIMNQAKEQGMPEDATARRDLVRRRPKSIVVPNVVDMDL